MTMNGLNGRVVKLERALQPSAPPTVCGACGLPHVRLQVSVALVEAITRRALNGEDVAVQPLCLCTPCCAEGQHIVQLTHGLPLEGTRWAD